MTSHTRGVMTSLTREVMTSHTRGVMKSQTRREVMKSRIRGGVMTYNYLVNRKIYGNRFISLNHGTLVMHCPPGPWDTGHALPPWTMGHWSYIAPLDHGTLVMHCPPGPWDTGHALPPWTMGHWSCIAPLDHGTQCMCQM